MLAESQTYQICIQNCIKIGPAIPDEFDNKHHDTRIGMMTSFEKLVYDDVPWCWEESPTVKNSYISSKNKVSEEKN